MKFIIVQFSPRSVSLPLGPNILLNTLLSKTLNLCSSLKVRDQVPHPYNTTGKITVLREEMVTGYYKQSEVFMTVKIQVEVCGVDTPCSISEDLAASIFRMINTTRRHNPEDLDLNVKVEGKFVPVLLLSTTT
jgi:hypothetical protein